MRYLKILYVQVLIGIALGIAVGHFYPALGASLEPLGVGFVNLIKMAIAPIIFVGVVSGIAHMSDMAKFGRVGVKTLLYFEIVSTLALAIGLIVAKVVQPGHGFSKAVSAADLAKVQDYAEKAEHLTIVEYLMNIIPKTFVSAFTDGNLLQVLLIAILTGFACARLGEFGAKVAHVCDDIGKIFFSIIHLIVKFAPIGAFGAMAFTIGKYGVGSLVQLGTLIGTFYITALAFVFLVLGAIAAFTGFSIVKFLGYIREELLIVLGTSSSESVLPQMMAKLQRLGAAKPVVGLVIPTGYSFNLDGTNIYMTLAVLFLAQATNTHLTLAQELTIIAVAMLTSKGASGVTGAGFITLTATLTAMPGPAEGGHLIPLYALTFIFGIDRFMSECRALTNLVGNGVATLAIARWEGELDSATLKRELDAGPTAPPPAPIPAPAEAEPD